MKSVAVFALVLVAVSASYYYKQPKFPCAYVMEMKAYDDGKDAGKYKIEVNGRYMKVKYEDGDDYEYTMLIRADIGGEGNVTWFYTEGEYCYVDPMEMEEAAYDLSIYGQGIMMYLDGRNWDKKKSEEWKGKKCDHYYDDDDDDEGLYVYDERVIGVVSRRYEYVIEYKWEAPMEDFVLDVKDCVKQEKKVGEVPSEDYIMCAASSLKVAFVAILAAFVVALF